MSEIGTIVWWPVVIGLSAWLGQVWATRIGQVARHAQQLELDALRRRFESEMLRSKTESDKLVFVHRMQFEKEFSVYVDLWSQLIEMRRAALGLRPVFDQMDLNESEDERRRARSTRFVTAHNAFLEVVDRQRPFIADVIYASCMKILDLALDEQTAYQYGDDRPSRDYWKDSQANAEKFRRLVDEVCDAVRTRINSMAVPDSA